MVKFILSKNRLYWWPIKIRMPSSDERKAGQVEEFTFKAQFEAIGSEEAQGIMDEVSKLPDDERTARQHDLLLRVVKDWNEDIQDEDKEPIPFGTDTLRTILDDPWILVAFWRAWGESMSGDGARKGNSQR
ncbi:hypothetical protein [Devosia sp.]|uniref:hypothetical protein n=1 Tax=Devosia sp. TaxID=1871048 RepID=UPI001AC7C1D2|nr:hypothetical protein [Devosia sp.]MBN9335624.1 hypothetical protein [Devosia sp.]